MISGQMEVASKSSVVIQNNNPDREIRKRGNNSVMRNEEQYQNLNIESQNTADGPFDNGSNNQVIGSTNTPGAVGSTNVMGKRLMKARIMNT